MRTRHVALDLFDRDSSFARSGESRLALLIRHELSVPNWRGAGHRPVPGGEKAAKADLQFQAGIAWQVAFNFRTTGDCQSMSGVMVGKRPSRLNDRHMLYNQEHRSVVSLILPRLWGETFATNSLLGIPAGHRHMVTLSAMCPQRSAAHRLYKRFVWSRSMSRFVKSGG